jgi:hypothetical protein
MITSGWECVISGANFMARERFTVSGGDRTVTKCWVRIGKQSGTGLLTIRLEDNAGGLIEGGTVNPSGVPTWTFGDGGHANGDWVGITFATPRVLTNGVEYCLRLSTDSASQYSMVALRRSQASDGADYLQSRGFYDGECEKTTNGGSSWARPYAYAPQNMQMYFEVA